MVLVRPVLVDFGTSVAAEQAMLQAKELRRVNNMRRLFTSDQMINQNKISIRLKLSTI